MASSPDFQIEAEIDRLAIQTFVKKQQQIPKIKLDESNIDYEESTNRERGNLHSAYSSILPQTGHSTSGNLSKTPDTMKHSSKRKIKY